MKIQDVIYFMFVLILGYLILRNWRGANSLLVSGIGGVNALTKTLQGR